MLQRNPIAFLLQLLLLSFYTLTKIIHDATTSQDTCPIEPCDTLKYCFYVESGPFIFKYLWGTSMWLKPNPYFSKPTHVTTENLTA